MNKSRIYLNILNATVTVGLLVLSACASDDLALENRQNGDRMSLGINVAQASEWAGTRAKAPAIKDCQVQTSGGKPIYAQFASEARISKHSNIHKTNRGGSLGQKTTRGVSVTSDTFYDQFGVYYYDYDQADSWAAISASGAATPTVSNMAIKKIEGWLTNEYWPGKGHKLTFMGYAPYDEDYKDGSGNKYIQFSANASGFPSLNYTVPDNVEDQQDLLVSAEPATQDMDGDYNKVIGMKFYHVLTAINFKIGSVMAPGTISKIEITGIQNQGSYDFGTRMWNAQSGSASYSITPNYVIDKQRGVVFTGEDDSKNDLFLVMPQTVPDGAKIIVTIEGHEMELPINGHEWLPGYTVTYTLSTSQENSDYIFSVSKINSIDKDATDVDYKVTSYVQSYYGSQTPVGWTAKYAVDEAIDANDFSTEYGDVVTGGFIFDNPSPASTTSDLTFQIEGLGSPTSTTDNAHTAALRAKTPLGSANSPHDLSMVGGSRSTANTYVVHAPGYYKFPLVYGNAIKKGIDNGAAYGKDNSAQPQFLNHLNVKITSPYISDNDIDIGDAVLVWQDAYNMIDPTSIGVTEDKKFLYFKVNEDYICQGNALLAVKDTDGRICWNWQIWVTDQDLSSASQVPVTNYQQSVYNFMPVPLGYCDEDVRTYKSREIAFQFEQEESGNMASVQFEQASSAVQEYGKNAPFYAFGSNIPSRIVAGIDNKTLKTFYFGSDEFYFGRITTDYAKRSVIIQNPTFTHYHNASEWISPKRTLYFWDANNTTAHLYDKSEQTSEKTVYDPCPFGYKIPEPTAFTGFTSNGGTQKTTANFNVSGTYDKGWYMFTQPGKQGRLFFIPAFGYMTNKQALTYIDGTVGHYWTCAPHSTTSHDNAYRFSMNKSLIEPEGSAYRAYNMNILPVADE